MSWHHRLKFETCDADASEGGPRSPAPRRRFGPLGGSCRVAPAGASASESSAKFSFVSSNVNFSKDDTFKGLFSDRISSKPKDGEIYNGMVKNIKGEKVGFFGLTTAETKDLSSPGKVEFENYIEEAEKAVKAFKGMGVNKIVAVSHIGYDDSAAVDNDLSLSCK